MKAKFHHFYLATLAFTCAILFCSFVRNFEAVQKLNLPYKKAGLTEQQAAAHLLNRFTYGAKDGDVEELIEMGLEKWLDKQLTGNLSDTDLDKRLAQFDAINLTNTEIENVFPRQAQIVRFAVRDGFIHKDSVNRQNTKAYRDTLAVYMQSKGLKPQQELYRQFINQKILRATYSNNQLRELLTEFWFNHFNVSLSKPQCAAYIPSFERDIIRPNVFGKFENLLLETAKSPAMLMYLDNFTSTGSNTVVDDRGNEIIAAKPNAKPKALQKNRQGLNENYAREVMELHTLGVDGGYTQSDVTQAARILTGWTLAPMGDDGYGKPMKNLIDRLGEENLRKRGFVHDGDFLFAMNKHDNGEKTVLGRKFPAGGGYEEGVELLKMLAHHKSTANFISTKLATRFVSDQPAKTLIDKMAKTFLSTNGDIKEVLITMVNAPEFWSKNALREKTKSPFELAISAVRSLNANVNQPYQLFSWINKMGQKIYYYQAPTGFPDRGQYWINTGSLLNRMNFGLALASKKIPGITFDLAALNNNHEPESAEAALMVYSKMFMPGRALNETVNRLKPMLNAPDLEANVAKAAERNTVNKQTMNANDEDTTLMDAMDKKQAQAKALANAKLQKNATSNMLSQVVGVIIGSPEYQRK
ncbi:DUF1800 domain-containing protein [Pedobacter namyangjuensis]|uniref:DUF1800 domain-containing protein n=1 Tax=Pedobacter namyangjuensis TaxID=600626 RepID=UPI000DE2BECD|nr:DUF1800 domain-containing protein [Pedobacter namyangjuensis]